jgi:hypothetical protein
MSKEKLLSMVKEELIREHKDSKYKIEKVVPYYLLIKNGEHELFNELFSECDQQDFYITYRYDREDWYSFGSIYVKFIPKDSEDDSYITQQKDETYFKIDLMWYEHGSTDEYIPRVIIKKCIESRFINFTGDSKNEFNKWYSSLSDLQEKEKTSRLKYINDEIKKLEEEKRQLEK